MKKLFGRSGLRRSSVAAAAVATALVLSACSGGGGSSSTSAGSASDLTAALQVGGELTYWSWTPSAKAQVAAFEKAYPKVKVNLVNAGTNTAEYTKLQNAIAAGSGAPDVAQVEYYAIPQFALAHSLVDLTGYGFGDLKGSYSTGPWGSVNFSNGIWGLPQDSGPMAMLYNKTLFDKYGIAVPTTWDEYIAAAKTLHAADPSAYIAADNGGDAGFATSMIWQAGGAPFAVDGTKLTVNLHDDGSKKWANTWSTLVSNKLVSPVATWSDDWYRSLGQNKVGTLLMGAWMPGILESSLPAGAGAWRVAPMPTYDGKPVTAENGGGGDVVLKQSKKPALAAAFLKWLNSNPTSISTFLASGGFPSTTADLKSNDFLNAAPAYFGGQKINKVLVDASADVPKGWKYLPYQVYAISIYGDTVGKAYTTGGDINAGLRAWQKELTDYGNQQGFSVNG